jgi:phosphatidylglycerophosphate synthase
MPHVNDLHEQHDPILVVSLASGDFAAADRDRATAQALVDSCADCAALHDDIVAIARATKALPAAARPRDFQLSPEQAAKLRPAGWRRLIAGLAAPGSIFSRQLGLGLATLGIVIHWFGDSLDGSLARYRRIDRPRYGYFLDHSVDALCNLTIMTGAGLSAYIRLDVALFALLGYFMLCMYVFLYNHVSLRFQLSFLALGPTELRVGLIGINCWMYFAGDSRIAIGGETFSPYDLVLCGAGIVFVGLFAGNVFHAARKLRREDASPGRPVAVGNGPLL